MRGCITTGEVQEVQALCNLGIVIASPTLHSSSEACAPTASRDMVLNGLKISEPDGADSIRLSDEEITRRIP